MKDFELLENEEFLDEKKSYEYKSTDEDYIELLDNMELEAAERAELKATENGENEDFFDIKDSSEPAFKTAEDWYFTYVLKKEDVLSTEEQLNLLKIYHTTNDKNEKYKARDMLLRTNQKLVVSIAKKCKISGISLDDLIQEGNMGLMKAIDKYDISTNYALSTYATYWIRQAIGRYIQEQGNFIRIPVNTLGKIYKFRRLISEFQRKGDNAPSDEELAKLMGCDKDQLTKVICYSNALEIVSMSIPIKGKKESFGEGIELQDSIPSCEDTPSDRYENKEGIKVLYEEMQEILSERTYDILCRRYGIGQYIKPQSLKEIGHFYGISKERVRQIQNRAEKQLAQSKKIRMFANKNDCKV